jgi:hypothetical protein
MPERPGGLERKCPIFVEVGAPGHRSWFSGPGVSIYRTALRGTLSGVLVSKACGQTSTGRLRWAASAAETQAEGRVSYICSAVQRGRHSEGAPSRSVREALLGLPAGLPSAVACQHRARRVRCARSAPEGETHAVGLPRLGLQLHGRRRVRLTVSSATATAAVADTFSEAATSAVGRDCRFAGVGTRCSSIGVSTRSTLPRPRLPILPRRRHCRPLAIPECHTARRELFSFESSCAFECSPPCVGSE